MTQKLKIAARLVRESIAPLDAAGRQKMLKEFLAMIASTEHIEMPVQRPNRHGNPVDCPYGIFRSRAECTRFILEHHKTEFLEKYKGFKVAAYSTRVAAIPGNSPEQHYIHWCIAKMCNDFNYSEWTYLVNKIKIS